MSLQEAPLPPPLPSPGVTLALPWPTHGGYAAAPAPLPDVAPFPSPFGGLQVQPEDCEAGSLRATGAASPAPYKAPSKAKGGPVGEVYVQDIRDSSRFRSVSKSRARRAMSASHAGKRSDGVARSVRSSELNSSFSRTLGTSMMTELGPASLSCLDPDASHLVAVDPADLEVGEVLAAAWRCEAAATTLCFLSQVLLAGLSIASILLILGAAEDEDLLKLLSVVWRKYSGGAMLFLSEVAALGSLLSLARVNHWRKYATATTMPSDEEAATGLAEPGPPTRDVLRRGLLAALHTGINLAIVSLCVVGSWSGKASESRFDFLAGPDRTMMLAQGILGTMAFLFALPEAARLLSASPHPFFTR